MMQNINKIVRTIMLDNHIRYYAISSPSQTKFKKEINNWIYHNFYADMDWYKKSLDFRLNIHKFMPNIKSIISIIIPYPQIRDFDLEEDKNRGVIANFGLFDDYHIKIRKILIKISKQLLEKIKTKFNYKICIDSSPILEKEFAYKSNLGFICKNTLLINSAYGSRFFIGEILLDIKLQTKNFDKNLINIKCGICNTQCPTKAINKPYILNAKKCISYLTIENKNIIPINLRKKLKNKIFGCDECQNICPYNKIEKIYNPFFTINKNLLYPKLKDLIVLNKEEFDNIFQNTSIKRCKYEGFMRNVINAIGNSENKNLSKYLDRFIKDKESKVLYTMAIWAKKELN